MLVVGVESITIATSLATFTLFAIYTFASYWHHLNHQAQNEVNFEAPYKIKRIATS